MCSSDLWSAVPDEGYWVCWDMVDNNACDTMWWPNGAATSKLVQDLPPGVYYWQVKTAGTQTYANGGVWWAFAVGTPEVNFGKQAPGQGAILMTNAATLTWNAAPGASFYETCVDTLDNNDCDTMWMPAASSQTRTVTGLTDGTYYWQVRATTPNGATQANLGAWWRLTVDAPDPIREYVYLGTKLLAELTLTTGTPVVSYYHTDVLGSVRAITDAAGAIVTRHDYFPFGESTSPLTGDPRRFTGKERDAETAFDYFDARYYRNVWGRFTTVDPVLRMDTFRGDPQLWNRYSYARQNPLRFVDPHGLEVIADEGSWNLIQSTIDSSFWKYLKWDKDGDHRITLVGSADEINKIGDLIFQALATLIRSSIVYNVQMSSKPQYTDNGSMWAVDGPSGEKNFYYKPAKAEGKSDEFYLGFTALIPPGTSRNEIRLWSGRGFLSRVFGIGSDPPLGRMRETAAHELFVHAWLWDVERVSEGSHTNARVATRIKEVVTALGIIRW